MAGFGVCLIAFPRAGVFLLGEATALGLLARLWPLTTGGPVSQALYAPLAGTQLVYRVDHLALLFAMTGVGIGVLLSLPWLARPWARLGRRGAWLMFAQFGMVTTALAGGLELMAAGWAMAIAGLTLLALFQRRVAPPIAMDGPTSRYIAVQASAAVLILAGAVAAETSAGTGAFDAIPISAFDVRVYLMLAAAPVTALLTLNLLCRALHRPLVAALAASTVVVPMSAYVLARLYDLSGGNLPDSRINALMILAGGVVAIGFAGASLWAVDLGAALVRLGQASAGMVLVAAGSGSGVGLAALLLAPLSLGLGLAGLLLVAQAGGGRLPAAPGGLFRRAAVMVPVLLTLGWAGALPVGLGLITILAALSSGVGIGGPTALATAPALLALPVMLVAAYTCGRFGEGRAPAAETRLRLGLVGIALAVSGLAAIPLAPTVSSLSAAVLRQPAADVQSALGSVPPGTGVAVALTLFVLVLACAATAYRRLDLAGGFAGAVTLLPPRLAVAPGIYGIRFAAAGRYQAAGAMSLVRRHPLVAGMVAWTGAVVATASLLR